MGIVNDSKNPKDFMSLQIPKNQWKFYRTNGVDPLNCSLGKHIYNECFVFIVGPRLKRPIFENQSKFGKYVPK